QALQQFRAVQRAYDNGDTAALADVMTPELYTETVSELRSRGLHVATVFDTLDADVLDVTTEADLYWVSVRFHGMSREDGASAAQAFDEAWNLCKPVDGSSGWLVAGIQQSVDA
ncbi:MAG: Tim44-like domain-containing protein, partial [Casimicrobiaceae bacterium]